VVNLGEENQESIRLRNCGTKVYSKMGSGDLVVKLIVPWSFSQ
jgi:hypothetical protein